MIGRLLDLSRRDAPRGPAELLAEFDLSEAADRPAKTYSGGMRRRLDLAASLVGRPSVMFLDEPTTGPGPDQAGRGLGDCPADLVAEGATVLLTTQYLDEADALADEITVLDHGRIIASGTPQALKRSSAIRACRCVPPTPPTWTGSRPCSAVADRRPSGPAAVPSPSPSTTTGR